MTKHRLDRLFTAYAILHDARCVVCGKIDTTLQGGHYFGRTCQSVKWDFRNCFCQCASCNAKHENNPEPLRRVAIARLGEEGFAQLERDSNESYPQPDVEWIHEQMMDVIRELPRWKGVDAFFRIKIRSGSFTNRALINSIHGYRL